MPLLEVTTNLVKSKIPQDFAKVTVDLVSTLLGKPKNRVVVVIRPEAVMSYGGENDDDGAVVHLTSIGKIDREANKRTTAALFSHFEKHLGIKGDKMSIVFHDEKGENIGHDGKISA